MSDIPTAVIINEEGPREGFQIESANIPTARKIDLIDALSRTGLRRIQIVSFVNPKAVPSMADAEAVVAGFDPAPGVEYTGLWLNDKGLQRALLAKRLTVLGDITICTSEPFLKRNRNVDFAAHRAMQRESIRIYRENSVPVVRGQLSAAFGCNFAGEISIPQVLDALQQVLDLAAENDVRLKQLLVADTMAWATPLSVKRVVGAVRERAPELEIVLHLHDTRGMGIANAYAGLEMGVRMFDASVAGLGGCPFAGHKGAAGNVCTEDLVFMCEEMGIATGIDLEALIGCARLAEEIVGHPLPGSVMRGGSLRQLRQAIRDGATA